MNKIVNTLLTTAVCLFIALPVYAGHGGQGHGGQGHGGHGHGENRLLDRIDRQHERIKQGAKSGELTRKEVKILKRQQHKIRHLSRHFREDGYLGKKERRILRRKLDRASDNIRELKHNDVYRYAHRNRRHEYAYRDGKGGFYMPDPEAIDWSRYGSGHRY